MHSRPERMLHHIRRLAARPAAVPDSDAALLNEFIGCRDEEAFTRLVQRHGGLVFGVCRRILGNASAAEDCTQATFVVLACKATTIRQPQQLAAWLYGTARRLAQRRRRSDLRRLRRESRTAEAREKLRQADVLDEMTARELLLVLEEELARLPEVYRMPLILCTLEGLSQEEAATRLGWTSGSIKGRLERGRAMLQARLRRRGWGLSSALASSLAAHGTASAALVRSSVQSALACAAGGSATVSPLVLTFVQEELQAMSMWKLKAVLAVFVVAGLASAGVGWLANGQAGGGKNSPVGNAVEARAKPETTVKGKASSHAEEEAQALLHEKLTRLEQAYQELRNQLSIKAKALAAEERRSRTKLVELEERLKEAEADAIHYREQTAEEQLWQKQLADITALVRSADEAVKDGRAKEEKYKRLTLQLDETKMRSLRAEQIRKEKREKLLMERIKLRNSIAELQERSRRDVQEVAREQEVGERNLEALVDCMRQLKAELLNLQLGKSKAPSTASAADRGLQSVERKLNAVRRELAELAREIRSLREASKK